MKVVGVIPARLGSTRLKEKVLVPLAGKPMIQHVWQRASQSKFVDQIIIACDDKRVLEVVKGFGAKAVMTDKELPSGTDRVAQAVKDIDAQVVINIQGDEPLIHHSVIDDLVKVFKKDDGVVMATAIKSISDFESLNNPNIVKVVIDKNKDALYFSRSVIPYDRSEEFNGYYKHLGIYAYTKDFLLKLTRLKRTPLEDAEKLEQLRVLENGYKIRTVLTDIETISVDTKEDIALVESALKRG